MRTVVIYLFLSITGFTHVFAGTQKWPGVEYKTVKAYLYNLDEKLFGAHQPVKKGRLDTTMLRPGATLSYQQVVEVLTVSNESTNLLQRGLSSCYIPHHAFVFFDKDDKPVAWISICFMCDAARFFPIKRVNEHEQSNPKKEKAVKTQLNRFKILMHDLQIPVYDKSTEYYEHAILLNYTKADSLEIEVAGFTAQKVKSYKWAKEAFNEFGNCEADMDSTVKIAAGGRRYYFFGIKNPYSEIRFSKGSQTYLPDYARIHEHCFQNLIKGFPVLAARSEMFEWLKSIQQKIYNTERFIVKDPDAHLKYTFIYSKDLLTEIAIDMY